MPALFLLWWAGCVSPRPPVGSSHTAQEDKRETMILSPPDSTVEYFYYPAPFDTVLIRPEPFDTSRAIEDQQVRVEVLVKGALPDACTELHEVEQERYARLIDVSIIMRRPRKQVCLSVVRPYRFYIWLKGRYAPGHYTLRINERVIPFTIRVPSRSGG